MERLSESSTPSVLDVNRSLPRSKSFTASRVGRAGMGVGREGIKSAAGRRVRGSAQAERSPVRFRAVSAINSDFCAAKLSCGAPGCVSPAPGKG